MKYLLALITVLWVAGCSSTSEITNRVSRDTVLVFQPDRIDTEYVVREVPKFIYNPDCDSAAILAKYGSFNLIAADTYYSLLAQYSAVTGRLRVIEARPAMTKVIPILEVYSSKITQKESPWERIKTIAVGFAVGIGFALIAYVLLKFKGIL